MEYSSCWLKRDDQLLLFLPLFAGADFLAALPDFFLAVPEDFLAVLDDVFLDLPADFFAGLAAFLPVRVVLAADFFAPVFLPADFFAPVFLAADFLGADFFAPLRGTFAPDSRASERPMAIAWRGLETFLPLLPALSRPLFISCMARSTFFCDFLEYLAMG